MNGKRARILGYLIIALLFGITAALQAVPLAGTYTIGGANPDYATLNLALNAINTEGQSADVNFTLGAGTYEGPFVIARPSSVYNFRLLAAPEAVVNLSNPSASSIENYILKIDNNSKIYIANLRFNTSGSYARSVVVHGNSDDLKFESNQFIFDGTAPTNSFNCEAISFYANVTGDSDNIQIYLNNFQNGGYHVYTNVYNSSTRFSNWDFYVNGHDGGIGACYLSQVENLRVLGDDADNTYYGIYLLSCSGSLELSRCDIKAKSSGIRIEGSSYAAPATPQVFNNIIRVTGQNLYSPSLFNSDAYGIILSNSSNVFVAHNSVDNSSEGTGSTALWMYGNNLVAKNNNLVTSGAGAAIYQYAVSGYTAQHNNLYSASANLAFIGTNTSYPIMNTKYITLDEYTAVAGGNNLSLSPYYDADLKTIIPRLDNFGLDCAVDFDYSNLPRDPNTPDLGAHEWTSDPLLTPLSGTITVGTGSDYVSFADFTYALCSRGVSSLLTVELTDSLYEEQIEINSIPGSSLTNYVTIKAQGRTNVVIRFSGQTASKNYLMYFRRASYIEFRNISFETLSSTYSNLLVFNGYNLYHRFSYCEFRAPSGASGYSIVTPYLSLTPKLDVLACDFYGNNTGIYHYGNLATIGSSSFSGLVIGVSMNQSQNSQISGNGFYDCTNTSINVNGGKSLQILRNYSDGSSTGINASNLELDGTVRNLIANNAIKVGLSNMKYGIQMSYGGGINLLNNTFYTQGTNCYALYCYEVPANLDIVNNIFVSEQAHAVEFTHYTSSADRVIDYNCYYSPSSILAMLNNVYYNSLAGMQSAYPTEHQHSIGWNPILSSDLHTQSPWLREIGIFRSELDLDMDMQPRGTLFDIGADQQQGEALSPLSGTYYIGSGGNYATLQDFLNELSIRGANGYLDASLKPGVHAGYNIIGDFPRSNPIYSLTITAQTGAVFQLNPLYSNSAENFILRLQGVDNLILQDLVMNSSSFQYGSTYLILNGKCDDIEIRNCSFNLTSPSNNINGIYSANSISDGLKISDCIFTGGSKALSLSGSDFATNCYQNIRLEDSSFSNCSLPVEISKASDLKLTNNTFSGFNQALNLSYIKGNTDILRNKMTAHNFVGSYNSAALVSLNYLTGSSAEEIEILSNIIYSRNNAVQAIIGLNLTNSSYVRLYHNTISVENTYTFEYGAAYYQANNSQIKSVNNIFASLRTGYAVNSVSCTDNYYANNAYYNGGMKPISLNNIIYETLAGIAALGDVAGVFANPYVDLNGYTTSNYLGNKAAPSYVQSDIDHVVYGSNIPLGASFVPYLELLSGIVQVGSAYPSLETALLAVMKRGITDNTAILVPSGNHPLSFELGYIPGTLFNTLTINGTAGAMLINNATGESDNFILKLRNVRNLNLFGLSFAPQNSAYSRCVVLERYNSDIKIEDCTFNVAASGLTSDAGAAIYLYNSPYDNLSIRSCQISNFPYGISISGPSAAADFANGLRIQANTIHNPYSGIAVYYANAPIIADNTISSYRVNGAVFAYNKGDLQFVLNRVSGSGQNALRLYQHTSGSPILANNYLLNSNINNSSVFRLEASNCKVYFNTMVSKSTSASASAFAQASGVTSLDFRNNICQAATGYAAILQSVASFTNLDHNLFYSTGTAAVKLNGANLNSLSGWTTATGDATCKFANPLLEENDYHLLATSPAINAGTSIDGFAYDLDSQLRVVPHDLGCSEYFSSGLSAPTNLTISRDSLTGDFSLSWNPVAGASSYTLQYSLNPGFATWNSYQPSVGTTATFPGALGLEHLFFRVVANH